MLILYDRMLFLNSGWEPKRLVTYGSEETIVKITNKPVISVGFLVNPLVIDKSVLKVIYRSKYMIKIYIKQVKMYNRTVFKDSWPL